MLMKVPRNTHESAKNTPEIFIEASKHAIMYPRRPELHAFPVRSTVHGIDERFMEG